MTDWKALCAELAGWIERSTRHYIQDPDVLIRARAALAEKPAPPTEGEIAELARWLRGNADSAANADHHEPAALLMRAADLLEQRHPAPVPVAERLPGPEDCDAEGRCWVQQPHEACPESPAWELMLAKYASPNYGATCWLPATVLPLPQGEVQP